MRSNKETNNSQPYAQGALITPPVPLTIGTPPLQYGGMIFIDGHISNHGQKVHINLDSEMAPGIVETPLHVGIRFAEHAVVRNSRLAGQWGHEERSGGLGSLHQGAPVNCIILVHPACYKIAFNGKHFADYEHRCLPEFVNTLKVDGQITLNSVHIQPPAHAHSIFNLGPNTVPSLTTGDVGKYNWSTDEVQAATDESVRGYGLQVPYKSLIKDGFSQGRAVYITGKTSRISRGFTINFLVDTSESKPQEVDIALHFCVRFTEKVVLCNTRLRNKWLAEERLHTQRENFPFQKGVHFDLVIVCEHDRYKVSLNNYHLLTYRHRMQQQKIVNVLEVFGDIELIYLEVQ